MYQKVLWNLKDMFSRMAGLKFEFLPPLYLFCGGVA